MQTKIMLDIKTIIDTLFPYPDTLEEERLYDELMEKLNKIDGIIMATVDDGK